ncbi:helix-turn-helix domain-containing protein [Ignavigranum ruoffiae]|uniref:DNA-binding transcriptional regulator, XRE-family HTH domain n=1 Tax=Ignavigranum ruoffiae TaxID=89093 RepID=A0A1H9CKF6_9LACT|nr:helix-turn-helix transcriptional regulator [Ignavigranum ruoffiae]UPQ86625.1 helix-turn-helix domain-containing protein [Ignavigranum ruoffiae]SEQ01700.1 DNA-binding transcriptional regulator, XRE-family HTH domain [Ignavigranum ruoffiae]
MTIGQQLKTARMQAGMTQEEISEALDVSRQTISNWENDKCYPDVRTVIELSELYQLSLDALLKKNKEFVQHIDDNTNVVKSNRKLIKAIVINILLILIVLLINYFLPLKIYGLVTIFILALCMTGFIYFELIRRL